MCNNQAVRSTILDRLVAPLRPVRPPDPFRRVGGQGDCRRAPDDGEDVVARLEAEFTEEQLEASGVMRRGADGQLRAMASSIAFAILHSSLTMPHARTMSRAAGPPFLPGSNERKRCSCTLSPFVFLLWL